MTLTGPEAALRHLDTSFDGWVKTLGDLCRIPSVSAAGFPREPVQRSADAMAELLRRIGMRNVRRLEVEGVHPYVYGEWLERPGAPTVLLYGHHDVVPPGRPERWQTPAFEPQERGGRLYARGSADDKGGIVAHIAAVEAWLAATGSLPLNVRWLIEGEEEIGSQNLHRLLAQHADLMQADYVVLSDTSNFDTGWPAITTRLRGLVQVDVEVSCLEQPVHSGQSGPLPDPVQVLSHILARLQKKDGSLDIPGLYDDVAKPTRAERRSMKSLEFDEREFRRSGGLLKGVKLAGERGYSVYEQLWTRPSLTVIAFEARPLLGASNQIVESARARISMRTVPDMKGKRAARQLMKALTAKPPHGAHVTARLVRTTPWWKTDPSGPAFDAALRALEKGYGKAAAYIGAGGSIGFVQPFTDHLPGVPCLLVGVEDPPCNAHSENESLHLGDWRKCMRSAVHLYGELAAL
jgi:acetylornithine deacetylase/succinyl-diaminopimelate desuccinylase-like protein